MYLVVDQHEQIGAFAAVGAGIRHEWPDQHIADPQLVRTRCFEPTEGAWLTGQGGTLQAAALKMLTNGELGNTDAVAGKEDGTDLGGRMRRQLGTQRTRLVEQLGVAADCAQVGAWVGFETIQALLVVCADPAIERAA